MELSDPIYEDTLHDRYSQSHFLNCEGPKNANSRKNKTLEV